MSLPTYYYIFMLCLLLQIFQESNTGKKMNVRLRSKDSKPPPSNTRIGLKCPLHDFGRPTFNQANQDSRPKQKAFSVSHFVCAPNVQISCGEKSGQQLNVKSRSSQSHCCMRVLAKHLKYFINIQKRNFDFEQFSKTFLFLV